MLLYSLYGWFVSVSNVKVVTIKSITNEIMEKEYSVFLIFNR